MVWDQNLVVQARNRAQNRAAIPVFGLSKQWRHATHGLLRITRQAKLAHTPTVNFDLVLHPPGGGAPIHTTCHATVVNVDPSANPTPLAGGHRGAPPHGVRGPSSIGYSDVDLGPLTGLGIIYLFHHFAALTGHEMGVQLFLVDTIVNDALHTVCQSCGMHYAAHPAGWQGSPQHVATCSLQKAITRGWI